MAMMNPKSTGHANMPTHRPQEPDAAVNLKNRNVEVAHGLGWQELDDCTEAELKAAVGILQNDLFVARQVRHRLMGQIMFYRHAIAEETVPDIPANIKGTE